MSFAISSERIVFPKHLLDIDSFLSKVPTFVTFCPYSVAPIKLSYHVWPNSFQSLSLTCPSWPETCENAFVKQPCSKGLGEDRKLKQMLLGVGQAQKRVLNPIMAFGGDFTESNPLGCAARLMEDGRFQELSLPPLQMKVPTASQRGWLWKNAKKMDSLKFKETFI